MLRSLMTAVTGVKAHQTMLDVTGNNIANVNTTGFKKDFAIFQDLLYQTTQGATGPGGTRGGVNPAQVGLGVQVSAIETIHTQGGAQATGNPTDMMIQGEGFFVLRDGGSRMYSRAGNFVRDANNDLVHSGTGFRVQGYRMERDPLNAQKFIRSSDLNDINIPLGRKMEPRGTSLVNFQCNLDSRTEPYLPIGYADLPFNTDPCGKPAKITVDGVEYDVSFKTNTTATTDDGLNYFTMTLTNGADSTDINFNMTGVKDGKPILVAPTASPGNWPGSNPPVAIAPADIKYDLDTGKLELFKEIGTPSIRQSVFQTNIKDKMNYTSFEVVDTEETPNVTIQVLAEFDETPSQMKGSPLNMTLWYITPGATPADPNTITRGTASIPVNDKGKFEFSQATITGATNGGFPSANFNEDNFKIVPSADGSTLDIQVAKNLTDPTTFDTVTQITQGGFWSTKQTIYDCNGNPHTMEVQFKKLTENRWRWEAFLISDDKDSTGSPLVFTPSSGEIAFQGCGQICSPEEVEINAPFSLEGKANQKIKLNFGGHGDKLLGVTQFASESTTKAVFQDGYTMGVLKDFSIGKDGTISGMYTNDQIEPLYQVALATFANAQGLDKVGSTMFRETVNSGQASIDPALVNGKGSILGGTLEMSNVDLTEEFTRLIISQRGFQANTRVVTTSDQILEEVVNLKR